MTDPCVTPKLCDEDTYQTVVLYVPTGSVDLYRNRDSWKKFANIVEEGTEGVDRPSLSASSIPVAYYDLDGKRLSTPQRGLNIIRMSDGTVRKKIIK